MFGQETATMTDYGVESDRGLAKTDHNSLHVNQTHKSGGRLREKQHGNELVNINEEAYI